MQKNPDVVRFESKTTEKFYSQYKVEKASTRKDKLPSQHTLIFYIGFNSTPVLS
jgi:hypothetical protein